MDFSQCRPNPGTGRRAGQCVPMLNYFAMPMDDLGLLFTITCGACQHTSPVDQWKQTEVFGSLRADEFQCPRCHRAFRRQPKPGRRSYDPFVEIVPIPTRL